MCGGKGQGSERGSGDGIRNRMDANTKTESITRASGNDLGSRVLQGGVVNEFAGAKPAKVD
ncbi:MAG: hypothetical protein LW834_20750, partial [Cyanobium sp. 49614_E6]|nr:hypothetical protein [Cyanobium sp. 49614_E6]